METHRDFGFGATGPSLLARPGPFKALARTDPTVEKRLMIGEILHTSPERRSRSELDLKG